jgi:polyhydroxybutyrate depolymerase
MNQFTKAFRWSLFFFLVLIQQSLCSQEYVYDSLVIDGLNRKYRLYIPDSYDGTQSVPLLFNLHGYGSNSLEQMLYADFRGIADTAGFIIACPEGVPDLFGSLSWNTFGLSTVDDIGFFNQFIEFISGQYEINQDRIYSTGMSNGGFMSYDLACGLNNKITAIASVTGSMNVIRINDCFPGRPVPVMQIHGTADATVPYIGNLAFSPIDTVVRFWYQHNECFPIPEVDELPDINPNDNCTATHFVWQAQGTAATVEFYKINGGGHTWPGAIVNLNITNMDFNASVEIWRFFSQYKLTDLQEPAKIDKNKLPETFLYPNPAHNLINIDLGYEPKNGVELNIYDLSGRMMMNSLQYEKLATHSINQLPPGIYLYELSEENQSSSRGKLIVQ